ncbi:MAG: hypothetical protein K6L74_02985 [Neptuniibacter sp.]
MIGSQVYKFSGAFYTKAIVLCLFGWVILNLVLGNHPLGGQFYIPFILFIYLLVQLSYRVEIRKDAVHIKRFGMGGKVSYKNLKKVSQENGTIGLYVDDGRQYNIPLSRFSKENQRKLTDQIDEFWSQAAVAEVTVERKSGSEIPEHMMKADAKRWISKLLDSGVPKKEVFEQLKGRGVKDSKLAMMIASVPDEVLCMLHEGKNNLLVGIYALSAVFVVWVTYVTMEPDIRMYVLAVQVTISLLLIWGFFSFKLLAYNIYIVFGVISLPKEILLVVSTGNIPEMVGIGIGVAMLSYVWFVRTRLYPDIGFVGVKKDKSGQYRFSD